MPHKQSKEGWLSVTEVLNIINKPFLTFWYGKLGTAECERIKKESQVLGVAVHDAIERSLKGELVEPEDKNVKRMVDLVFQKFINPYQVEVVSCEPSEALEDTKLKLQGTYDLIARINGEKPLIIIDFKTSNQLDKVSVPLQLAAYAHLYGQGIDTGMAVRVDKVKDKVDIETFTNLRRKYWPVFLACLKVARYAKEK